MTWDLFKQTQMENLNADDFFTNHRLLIMWLRQQMPYDKSPDVLTS